MPTHFHRRTLLRAALAVACPASLARAAGAAPPPAAEVRREHFPFGEVWPPRVVPPWSVHTADGRRTDLPGLLTGRTTAIQLMFTGCSSICPIQGALFAELQQRLGDAAKAERLQLLSLSIDPLADDPPALTAWLQRFGAT